MTDRAPMAPRRRRRGHAGARRLDVLRPARSCRSRRVGSTSSSPGGSEMAVLPLSGGPITVDVEGRRFELDGRATVFAAVTDWAYLPIDAEVRLSSASGAEVALPSARATRRFDPALVAAGDVAVEVRGAGPATRQVTNFMSPESVRRRRQADVRRAADAGRQLVELPAAPPRRQPGVPGQQRGDLLLPRRPRRHDRLRPRRVRHAPYVHARGRCRRHRARSATATSFSSSAATTARASPPRATRSTTSTSSPALAVSDRWRSATTRPTTGCAIRGMGWSPTPRVPLTGASTGG